jgi:hypothetical protein
MRVEMKLQNYLYTSSSASSSTASSPKSSGSQTPRESVIAKAYEVDDFESISDFNPQSNILSAQPSASQIVPEIMEDIQSGSAEIATELEIDEQVPEVLSAAEISQKLDSEIEEVLGNDVNISVHEALSHPSDESFSQLNYSVLKTSLPTLSGDKNSDKYEAMDILLNLRQRTLEDQVKNEIKLLRHQRKSLMEVGNRDQKLIHKSLDLVRKSIRVCHTKYFGLNCIDRNGRLYSNLPLKKLK